MGTFLFSLLLKFVPTATVGFQSLGLAGTLQPAVGLLGLQSWVNLDLILTARLRQHWMILTATCMTSENHNRRCHEDAVFVILFRGWRLSAGFSKLKQSFGIALAAITIGTHQDLI